MGGGGGRGEGRTTQPGKRMENQLAGSGKKERGMAGNCKTAVTDISDDLASSYRSLVIEMKSSFIFSSLTLTVCVFACAYAHICVYITPIPFVLFSPFPSVFCVSFMIVNVKILSFFYFEVILDSEIAEIVIL